MVGRKGVDGSAQAGVSRMWSYPGHVDTTLRTHDLGPNEVRHATTKKHGKGRTTAPQRRVQNGGAVAGR
jgi:hypothetical protein